MIKILFGTTALATAALLSVGASAAKAPTLKISGYYNTAVIFGDDGSKTYDNDGQLNGTDTNISFEDNDAKFVFNVEGTADNGLTYGAVVKYRATNDGTDRIHDNYVYFKGAFGKIEFGSRKGVANNMTYQGPSPDQAAMIGMDSPSYYPQGGGTALTTVSTYNSLTGRSEKLNYYTPRIEGFQLGLTYTPHGCRDGQDYKVGAATGTTTNPSTGDEYPVTDVSPVAVPTHVPCVSSGGFENNADGNGGQEFEVAVNFSREFSGVTLSMSANYTHAQKPSGKAQDRSAYGFGGSVGFGVGAGTVTIGGGYLEGKNKEWVKHTGYQSFEGGIGYAQGPWQVGIESVYGDKGATNAGQGNPGHARTFGIGVGGGYQLAQGLTLSAGYMHYSYGIKDGDPSTSKPGAANVFLIGTGISF